jgi:nucleoside phosphorylase
MNLPVALIMTAIDEEYQAVKKYLSDIQDHWIDGTYYQSGTLNLEKESIATVYIKMSGQTNVNAAIETQRAISNLKPNVEYVFFVGIAGGVKDVKKGDVVFSSKTYYYEVQKLTKDGEGYSPDVVKPDYEIAQLVESERSKFEWCVLLDEKKSRPINILAAPIASGEKLVDSYDSHVSKLIQKKYRDTVAIEMEGFGFGNVLMKQGGSTRNIYHGVFRGISDIVRAEYENSNQSKRSNRDKEVASTNSAAFALWILIKHVRQKKNPISS